MYTPNMTLINHTFTRPTASNTPAPVSGTITAQPTRKRIITGAPNNTVLPAPFNHHFNSTIHNFNLEPTTGEWCWKLTYKIPGISAWEEHVLVPTTDSADLSDLVRVNPDTLDKEPEAKSIWWAKLEELIALGGIKGDPGEDGADGIDGTNGIDGINGIDGKDGRPGTDGIDGKDGVDGVTYAINVKDFPTPQEALNIGGRVIFPRDTYTLTTDLVVKTGTEIDLNNSTIVGGGFIFAGETSNISLYNGKITDAKNAGIRVENSRGPLIEKIRFERCNTGIALVGVGTGTMGNEFAHVKDCQIIDSKDGAIQTFRSRNAVLDNIYSNNSRWGINILSYTENITLNDSQFILRAPTTTPTGSDTYYTGSPEHGVYAHDHDNLTINNTIFDGWNRANGCSGVKLRNAKNTALNKVTTKNCKQDVGLYLQTGSTNNYLTNTRFNRCTFMGNTTDGVVIFVHDYIASNSEMDIQFTDCGFVTKTSINPAIGRGSVLVNNAYFSDAVTLNGSQFNIIVKNSFFEKSDTFNILATDKCVIMDNIFQDWNTNNVASGLELEQTSGAISILNKKNVSVLRNKFLNKTKRSIGGRGTVAGGIANAAIIGNEGGNGIYLYQSGINDTNIVGQNVFYGDTILNGGANNIASLGNNIAIKTDGTIATV